ncbi:MAG: anhydro-N-acetylmuramic acid kinase [Flavobacteriales bacterium]
MKGSQELRYRALGVMSGSSLDGLDLALCSFTLLDGRWRFTIDDTYTVPYEAAFQERLQAVMAGPALELARLDRDLGDLIGRCCAAFLQGRSVDVIGSHGHTVFHKPDEGLTVQIGQGARIAALTGAPVLFDFRTKDMALGGQGAPLVPLGEKCLFPDHRLYLNIGGICNIAQHDGERVLGYDVCIGNQALNFLAGLEGLPYDREGLLARSGQVDQSLLKRLNDLPFHRRTPPRSLGREWFQEDLLPLIARPDLAVKDRLRTVVEHIASTVANALGAGDGTVLTTGGGAHSTFLIERLQALMGNRLVVPEPIVVDFKEALIFAFLGVRGLRGESTALASVTGASRDSSGGQLVNAN